MSNLISIHNKENMTPLVDSLWFESHQALLLRMVATNYGRDLLVIPQDFEEIVKIEPSSVHGLLGFEGEDAKIVAKYYTSDRFANTIRHRWAEFASYAKYFYDNGGQTNIWLEGQWRLASTTETFYPEPAVAIVAGDASVGYSNAVTWTSARGATIGNVISESTGFIIAEWLSGGTAYRVYRDFFNFDTSSLPTAIDSATVNLYQTGTLVNDYGDESLHIVTATPASPAVMVLDDFDQVSFTSLVSKTLASISLNAYNVFTVGDLTAINTSGGVTSLAGILGRDQSNSAPVVQDNGNYTLIALSEAAGTSTDPYLEVIYGVRQRFIGTRPVLTVDKQIIGNRGNPIIR